MRLQQVPYRTVSLNLTSWLVEFSREARIRALCVQARMTTDVSEVDVLAELRAELHTHIEELRNQTGREIPLLFHPQNEAAD